MQKGLICLGLAAGMNLGSLGAAGLLYDGVLQYWHADMGGSAGTTAGAKSSVDGPSSGVITFGFRLDNGRSLLDVLYTSFDTDGYFNGDGRLWATDHTRGVPFQATLTPGSSVNYSIDKIDIHLRHPVYRAQNTRVRAIAGLTYADVQDDYRLPPVSGGAAGASWDNWLGVLGLELEHYLGRRASLRGSYKYGTSLGDGDMDLKDWELGAVFAARKNIEVEAGYRSMTLKTSIFEGTPQEGELRHEFDGPYTRMNYLF